MSASYASMPYRHTRGAHNHHSAGAQASCCWDTRALPTHKTCTQLSFPCCAGIVLLPVLRTLAHAHEIGYMHRDIKASNILLGDQGQVQLADWGICGVVPGFEEGLQRPSPTFTPPFGARFSDDGDGVAVTDADALLLACEQTSPRDGAALALRAAGSPSGSLRCKGGPLRSPTRTSGAPAEANGNCDAAEKAASVSRPPLRPPVSCFCMNAVRGCMHHVCICHVWVCMRAPCEEARHAVDTITNIVRG